MDVTSTNVSETGSNFVIPVGIVAGIHRMRVWSGYTGSFVPSDINTVTTGCESLNSGTNIGDVRDFNVDLICPTPTISGLATNKVCASASVQSINLSYTGVTNTPNQYSITWNPAAITAGLVNVGFTALPASPISVSIPAALAANTYSGTLVVKNACGTVSVGDPISITINPIPNAPTSAGDVGICADIPSGVLTATSAGNVVDWFNNPTGGSSINTGTTLTTGTAGTYYTQATTLATGCVNLTRTPITLTINPLPVDTFNVTGGACTPAVMGLDGSEVGVNYQLIRTDTFNVVSNVGSIYAGTGSALYMGYQNVAGTYQVVATSVVGGCTRMMKGVSTVGLCISEWGGFTSDDWFTNTNWLPPAVPNICGATIVIYANRAPFPVIRTGPNTSDVQVGKYVY
ncbi:MAG: hypothetical protein IPP77_05175 [Bacteroidetes bacterium]|nr:hypothetical protein [Bacteroidota bacterium]